MKPNLMIVTILALTLSACGAKATPTPDVMGTANAAASTMIAETQAALPTETPIPPTEAPTETPQPTPTIPSLPTVPVLASPTRAAIIGGGGGECSGVISTSKGESTATIVINNNTKVLLGVSLYLNKNFFGDCGFWSSPAGIPPNSSVTLSDFPASNSCYHVTAWTLAGKPIFKEANDFCIGFNVTQSRLNVTTTSISVP
jgi:hypothetical protein